MMRYPEKVVFAVFVNSEGDSISGLISESDLIRFREDKGKQEFRVVTACDISVLKNLIGRMEAGKTDFTVKSSVTLLWNEE